MIVEVWCPGPSLKPVDTINHIVAVNRAALSIPADAGGGVHWAVSRDKSMVEAVDRWIHDTYGDVPEAIQRNQRQWRYLTDDANVLRIATLTDIPVYGTSLLARWQADGMRFKYSKIVALALAASIMPDSGEQNRIIIRGDDMAGTLDWDGVAAGDRRDEARWESERKDTEKAAAILRNVGIELEWV